MGKNKHAWLFCLVFSFSGVTLVAALHTRSQVAVHQEPSRREQLKKDESVDTSQFPVTDFNASDAPDPKERAKREVKSKKYDSRHSPAITESTTTTSHTDWEFGLPALPVANSSLVITGEVTKAAAYLSEDKSAVYSEFVVLVDGILKNDSRNQLTPGALVAFERMGGRVRFPSGKIAVSSTSNQDMPRVGKRYALFLTNRFPIGGDYEEFYLLTAYELRGGRVFPLDKVPGHPINTYTEADERSFLNDLWSAISSASPTTQLGKSPTKKGEPHLFCVVLLAVDVRSGDHAYEGITRPTDRLLAST